MPLLKKLFNKNKQQSTVDTASYDSFPASDPPAWSSVSGVKNGKIRTDDVKKVGFWRRLRDEVMRLKNRRPKTSP